MTILDRLVTELNYAPWIPEFQANPTPAYAAKILNMPIEISTANRSP